MSHNTVCNLLVMRTGNTMLSPVLRRNKRMNVGTLLAKFPSTSDDANSE